MARPPLFPTPGGALDEFYDALPDHYEAADAAAPEPTGLPALLAAVNTARNPATEVDATGWSASNAGTSFALNRVTDWSAPETVGNGSIKLTMGTGALLNGAGHYVRHAPDNAVYHPIAPDQHVAVRFHIKAIVPLKVRASAVWYNVTPTVVGVPAYGPYVTLAVGETAVVYVAGVAPAGATQVLARTYLYNADGTAPSPGDFAMFDAGLVQVTNTAAELVGPDDYFDGSTVYPDQYGLPVVSWAGAAHQSNSVRQARAGQSDGYPLYRWLAGSLAVFGEVTAMLARLDYDPELPELGTTSDLTDPVTADAVWLPWIAQLVGVPLQASMSEGEARDAVRFASAGWRAGTKTAVADAARSELTGTKYARVYDHSVAAPGDGGQWDVLIVTRVTETPDVPAVLAAVVRRGAKPAGVVLHHRAYESTWDTVTATYPTWAAIETAGQWNKLQEAGL